MSDRQDALDAIDKMTFEDWDKFWLELDMREERQKMAALNRPLGNRANKLMEQFSQWFANVSELNDIDDIEAIKYIVMEVMPDLPSKEHK